MKPLRFFHSTHGVISESLLSHLLLSLGKKILNQFSKVASGQTVMQNEASVIDLSPRFTLFAGSWKGDADGGCISGSVLRQKGAR